MLHTRRNGKPLVVIDARVVTGVGGGPDKTILNSPRFLPGYRNLCVYMRPPWDRGFAALQEKARQLGAPLLGIDDRGFWDFKLVFELLNLCRRERVAIWHGHDYKTNALGLLLNRFWPMRLVTTVHGWVERSRRTPLYFFIDRLCLPYYERVICVSEDLYHESLACGVPRERCLLIENGIDTEQYRRRQSTAEAKRAFGVPPGRLVVGAVGRLAPEKGFDVLIRSANRLLRQGLDLEVWIIGEGDARASLERLIGELGRPDRVRLLGYQGQTVPLYLAMDVFALSSLREGLPNVLLEAMALEVPALATRIAGVPRLIRDGDNGLLVEPGDEEALTRVLARLLADAGLRERLGQEGRRTIEMSYSFEVRMGKVRELYDQLVGLTPTTERGSNVASGRSQGDPSAA